MSDDVGICWWCECSRPISKCCSSHEKQLCHGCYRLTHFVEVCGCKRCDREGLPRIYPVRAS